MGTSLISYTVIHTIIRKTYQAISVYSYLIHLLSWLSQYYWNFVYCFKFDFNQIQSLFRYLIKCINTFVIVFLSCRFRETEKIFKKVVYPGLETLKVVDRNGVPISYQGFNSMRSKSFILSPRGVPMKTPNHVYSGCHTHQAKPINLVRFALIIFIITHIG